MNETGELDRAGQIRLGAAGPQLVGEPLVAAKRVAVQLEPHVAVLRTEFGHRS